MGFWTRLTGNADALETRAGTTPDGITPPSREAVGASVTAREALGLSTVYRAVSIRATAESRFSCATFKMTAFFVGEFVCDTADSGMTVLRIV